MMYVGLDVHKRVCYGTLMDEESNIVRWERVASDPQSLRSFLDGVEGATVAMEAGYCAREYKKWWAEQGSNLRLPPCQGDVITTRPHARRREGGDRAREEGDLG